MMNALRRRAYSIIARQRRLSSTLHSFEILSRASTKPSRAARVALTLTSTAASLLAAHQVAALTPSASQSSWLFAAEPGTVEHLQELLKKLELEEMGNIPQFQSNETITDTVKPNNEAYFPSLDTCLVVNDDSAGGGENFPFVLNSQDAIPIETDLFVGTLKLVLKPLEPSHDPNFESNEDPHYFYFELEGNFTQDLPLEELYMGGQITEPMTGLGHIGRQVCHLFLRLLGSNIPGEMRYSFGIAETVEGKSVAKEMPFISFPLSTAMDQIAAQKQGEDNPVDMKAELANDDASRHAGLDAWRSSTRYKMSYTADCVDLASWKILQPFEFASN
mmetsp:Transcript_14552/g.30054  ORF Transcript_14552/g.30054 Transcript_14552/m.30054 type:complete len:333 (-) Transcript_14552:2-1000(-)